MVKGMGNGEKKGFVFEWVIKDIGALFFYGIACHQYILLILIFICVHQSNQIKTKTEETQITLHGQLIN